MTTYLKEQTLELSSGAEKLENKIIICPNSVQEAMVLLQDEKQKKVVALFDVSTASPHPTIRSYIIDPKQYIWADSEGFTLQEMYEKLGDRVFSEIPFTSVLAYLLLDSNII